MSLGSFRVKHSRNLLLSQCPNIHLEKTPKLSRLTSGSPGPQHNIETRHHNSGSLEILLVEPSPTLSRFISPITEYVGVAGARSFKALQLLSNIPEIIWDLDRSRHSDHGCQLLCGPEPSPPWTPPTSPSNVHAGAARSGPGRAYS